MNLLTLLFRLPFLPVRGLVALGELIQDEAERELHDPSRVRRELEEVEVARVRGEASDQDVARIDCEAVGRLVGSSSRPAVGADDHGS